MKSALKEAKHTCGPLLYTRWTSCTYSNSTSRWRTSTPNTEHLLALSVFQVKVWVEVDQNPLVRSWSCNHPYAFLRWVVRHRITGWSEVICATDFDIVPTFVWKNRKKKKIIHTENTLLVTNIQYRMLCFECCKPNFLTSWTRFIREIMLIDQLHLFCWFTNQ